MLASSHSGRPALPSGPPDHLVVDVEEARDCVRAVGSLLEDPPHHLEGLRDLNVLVREAKRQRGAVRTPPPDPTFAGQVSAYLLLFRDAAAAGALEARGARAVEELRERYGPSGMRVDAQTSEAVGNVLVLYLNDPARATAQRDALIACLTEGTRAYRPPLPVSVRVPEPSPSSLWSSWCPRSAWDSRWVAGGGLRSRPCRSAFCSRRGPAGIPPCSFSPCTSERWQSE
jgi:hypothetical protein